MDGSSDLQVGCSCVVLLAVPPQTISLESGVRSLWPWQATEYIHWPRQAGLQATAGWITGHGRLRFLAMAGYDIVCAFPGHHRPSEGWREPFAFHLQRVIRRREASHWLARSNEKSLVVRRHRGAIGQWRQDIGDHWSVRARHRKAIGQ